MNKKATLSLQNRIVSMIYGVLVVSMSFIELIHGEKFCGSLTTAGEYNVMIMTSGFQAFDILYLAYFDLLGFDMALHHISCMTAMASCAHYGKGSNFALMCLMTADFSMPIMHIRVFLKSVGLRYTRVYEVCEILFFGSYIVSRMGFLQVINYFLLTCD